MDLSIRRKRVDCRTGSQGERTRTRTARREIPRRFSYLSVAYLLLVITATMYTSNSWCMRLPLTVRAWQSRTCMLFNRRIVSSRRCRGIVSSAKAGDDVQVERRDNTSSTECKSPETNDVTILDQGEHYLVVSKPPSVVCHHSDMTGSRSREEVPMLQRVRDALGGRRVNLIHRIDRGTSGCLLMSFAQSEDAIDGRNADKAKSPTALLSQALASPDARKTYVALVRGEGILHGRDFRKEGWFMVDRPIKDYNGVIRNATTWFRFVAGQDNARGTIDRPRASLVLARPVTGRWHQIRRHLNGLSHPILGDSTHGNTRVNKEWRQLYNMPPERTCLHLAQIVIPPTVHACPDGIVAVSPLESDLLSILQNHLPSVLEAAEPVLLEEGIRLY